MKIKCPHCKSELSKEEVEEIASQLVSSGVLAYKKERKQRSDIGKEHKKPAPYERGERKPEAHSDLKAITSAENGRKFGGRPKGSKNKAPRADKGVPRGPRDSSKKDGIE